MPEKPLSFYRHRDAEIVKLFASGYSTKELAKEYEINVERIRQIIRWNGGRKRKPTKRTPRQIMLGLGIDADLVRLELIRSMSSSD